MANIKQIRGGNKTHFYAIIANGPQFAAQLTAIEVRVAKAVSRQGMQAAGQAIADEWKGRVPVRDGHYRNSIKVSTSARSRAVPSDDDSGGMGSGARQFSGASAKVYAGEVPGVPDAEQPWRYAGVLEYGGKLTPAQRGSFIPAQPSARPAFDSAKDKAVNAFENELQKALG